MVEWQTVKLGDIIEIHDHKRIPLSSTERQGRQGVYPYYGASGVIDHIDDYIFDGRYILIAEDGENLNSRKLPIAFFADGQFWVNNHAHIVRAKAGIAEDQFIVGWFAQADISGYITGTAQPKLSQANLKQIEIPLPPIETQRRIAAILSAYDDLIENNTRRIKLLEQAAHDLYREWFVEFRFPGHESVPLVDSDTEYGMIPQGWGLVQLGEVAEVNALSVRNDDTPTEIEYVDISSVSTGRIDNTQIMSFEDAPGRARRIVRHGDTIWATVRPNRRSYALILRPSENLIVSTGFAVITPSKVPYCYLYQAITTDAFAEYLTNHATGSAYPAVNANDFKSADILVPSLDVAEEFQSIIADFYDEKAILEQKTNALREARDLLLPRLVSGQLDVSDIEVRGS